MLLLPRWTGCSLCLIIAATTILFFIFAFNSVDNREVINDAQQDSSSSASSSTSTLNGKPKIWVSMSLCFGETTTKHGKQNYPYADVTLLSILIWNYFYPPESGVEVLLQLIHNEPSITVEMREYEDKLKKMNVTHQWEQRNGIDCVLKSQLARMFAFGHPLVKAQDIVATIDVNMFIATASFLDPIFANPGRLAWIYQYDIVQDATNDKGENFPQNVVAMPAGIWRSVLEAPSKLTKKWLDQKINEMDLDRDDSWNYDQWITTISLLKHRICSVPQSNGLWRNKGLSFDPDLDDSPTCWHGRKYTDCNRKRETIPGGCKWWHFFPDEDFDTHVQRFRQITNDVFEDKLAAIFDELPV